MATFEIKMPKLGESITEGTIISWSVKTGDLIKEDDVLFEVSTAKVSAEIPSPVAGKVLEILFQEGDTVAVGTTVAVILLEGSEEEDAPDHKASEQKVEKGTTAAAPAGNSNTISSGPVPKKTGDGIRLSYSKWPAKPICRKRNWIRFPEQVTWDV